MHTTKGYIIPALLVVLLLILAGFFVFSSPQQEVPAVSVPTTSSALPVATSTSVIPEEVDQVEPDVATSTRSENEATTTESVDLLE